MSSNTLNNTPLCQRTLQQTSEKSTSSLSKQKMLGIYTPYTSNTTGHVLPPSPSDQNCKTPFTIPLMSCGQVYSSQPLAHNPNSIPIRDLTNG